MDKICICTNLTKSKIKDIVYNQNISWEKFIDKTGASQHCGTCYSELKKCFFYFKYQKKICNSQNLLLFKDI